MSKVFISYSSTDSIFADLTRMKLNAAGIQVWLDSGELRAGEEWRDAIDRGISSTELLLVILTPRSCESPYVTYEWGFALGRGKSVIPLLLEDADVHPRLEVFQYLDFRDRKSLPWDQLIVEITDKAASGNGDAAPPLVRDMTSAQLQEIIAGAVALSNATRKATGQESQADEISRTADSVMDAIQRSSSSPRSQEQRCILWVDDHPDNNIYARNAFESIGFSFELAQSTDEALGMLAQRPFAAIISDMGRREGPKEGYVLLDALRKHDADTPFFIYAGSNDPKYKQEAQRRGAQGTTNNPRELFELVTQQLS